jgi:hypothetical protein
MPASNIETIYQFESALESCIETILQTDASLTCYKQKDTDIKASPWAEVQCTGVSANGKQYKTGTNGFNWPIDFTSTVQVTVTTNREQNTSSHAAYLGKVRRYLYDLSSYTTQRLPYLAVSLVSESGSSAVFVDDERFDQTVLQFRVNFTIRHEAWPQEEWTPASIAGLQLWLDANQITGLNDGDAVATWSDLSGNSRDNTQATVSKRPIWKTTYVKFDGVDDFMTGALPNISQPFTVAFRVRQLNDGFVFSSPGTTYLPFLRSYYFTGANLVGSPFNTTDYHTVLFEANGGTSIARVDGVVNVSGNAGSAGIASGAAACELGAWSAGSSFWCQMNLKSLVIYNRALTAGEISALEAYLDALP